MVREPPSGIDILVVGSGLGGLFSSIELHRQGHNVRIIESKPKIEGFGSYKPSTVDGTPSLIMSNFRRLRRHRTISYETVQQMARNDGEVPGYHLST